MRALVLVYRWLLLIVSSQDRESELSGVSSDKDTNPVGSGPHPYDLFILNYFLKAPISKNSYIGS